MVARRSEFDTVNAGAGIGISDLESQKLQIMAIVDIYYIIIIAAIYDSSAVYRLNRYSVIAHSVTVTDIPVHVIGTGLNQQGVSSLEQISVILYVLCRRGDIGCGR